MPSKNIILDSFKESLALIWKNKSLFVLLLVLQIAFFVLFSIISYNYVPKMIEGQKAIEEYLSNIKFDEASVAANMLEQRNVLGDDPLLISRNFKEIMRNFRLYLIYIFILIVFSISVFWAITSKIIHKISLKQLTKIFLKIFIVALSYLGLIFIFFFSLLNVSLTGAAEESTKLLTKDVPFFIFSIILVYFMFVSISLIYHTELKNVVQETLKIGVKKIHYVLAAYLINIILFIISIFLMYYFIERNLFILLVSIILMLFSFIFGRVFMVSVVGKLERN